MIEGSGFQVRGAVLGSSSFGLLPFSVVSGVPWALFRGLGSVSSIPY